MKGGVQKEKNDFSEKWTEGAPEGSGKRMALRWQEWQLGALMPTEKPSDFSARRFLRSVEKLVRRQKWARFGKRLALSFLLVVVALAVVRAVFSGSGEEWSWVLLGTGGFGVIFGVRGWWGRRSLEELARWLEGCGGDREELLSTALFLEKREAQVDSVREKAGAEWTVSRAKSLIESALRLRAGRWMMGIALVLVGLGVWWPRHGEWLGEALVTPLEEQADLGNLGALAFEVEPKPGARLREGDDLLVRVRYDGWLPGRQAELWVDEAASPLLAMVERDGWASFELGALRKPMNFQAQSGFGKSERWHVGMIAAPRSRMLQAEVTFPTAAGWDNQQIEVGEQLVVPPGSRLRFITEIEADDHANLAFVEGGKVLEKLDAVRGAIEWAHEVEKESISRLVAPEFQEPTGVLEEWQVILQLEKSAQISAAKSGDRLEFLIEDDLDPLDIWLEEEGERATVELSVTKIQSSQPDQPGQWQITADLSQLEADGVRSFQLAVRETGWLGQPVRTTRSAALEWEKKSPKPDPKTIWKAKRALSALKKAAQKADPKLQLADAKKAVAEAKTIPNLQKAAEKAEKAIETAQSNQEEVIGNTSQQDPKPAPSEDKLSSNKLDQAIEELNEAVEELKNSLQSPANNQNGEVTPKNEKPSQQNGALANSTENNGQSQSQSQSGNPTQTATGASDGNQKVEPQEGPQLSQDPPLPIGKSQPLTQREGKGTANQFLKKRTRSSVGARYFELLEGDRP